MLKILLRKSVVFSLGGGEGSHTASVATPSSPRGKTFSAESDQELLLVSFSIVVTNVSYHRALCLHTCAHFLAVAQNIWFRTGEN